MHSPRNIADALRLFGKEAFRPMQRELIEAALAGKSSIGILPTGSGKSLCYQIPAVMLPGLTLVVSPLIALMRDQVDGLARLGVRAARYDSSLPEEDRQEVLRLASSGELSMLFAAPESLGSTDLQRALDAAQPGLFVIDEAHCVSEWGHSFRPDYLALPDYARQRRFHAVMALTATATPRVRDDLAHIFGVEPQEVFCLPPTRENIVRRVATLPLDQKIDELAQLLAGPSSTPAIVYASTRKDTEEVAALLAGRGLAAKAYHAGMPTEIRAAIQDGFLHGDVPVLVATIAFGMGIDKPDVRTVVHYHLASSPEAYVQESGRAGRDGLSSQSVVFYHGSDYRAACNRIRAAVPDRAALRLLLGRLLARGQNVISLYEASTECDVSDQVLDRVLFDLGREGVVRVLSKGWKYYKATPLFPIDVITSGREGDEAAWLVWLAANRDGELIDVALATGKTWQEAVEWFDELALSGEWKIAMRQRALLVDGGVGEPRLDERADALYSLFELQCGHDLQRLDQARDFFLGGRCLTNCLDDYFGFARECDCGYCGVCTSSCPETRENDDAAPAICDDAFEMIAALVGEQRPALARPGQLTRFLLGFAGPAAMRARLWGHPLYGSLGGHSWDEVHAVSLAMLGS